MNGIILAGGTGSRLTPCSKLINKHLLPVYNRPMVYFPIQFLQKSGITKIIIVVNKGKQAQLVAEAISYEKQFDSLDIKYVAQESQRGTAHAISLCRDLLDTSSFIVAWGDNIFEYCKLGSFDERYGTVKIFLKEVDEIAHYGCVKLNENGEVIDIISNDKKNMVSGKGLALTGLFVLDDRFFDYINKIKPNHNNELDFVDALKEYIKTDRIEVELVSGFWIDAASSFDNLLNSALLVKNHSANKIRK